MFERKPNLLPSLDRAYGARGALIAVSMAAIAGSVHGVLAASFGSVAPKVAVGFAGALVLIMAGALSARQSAPGAVMLGLGMGVVFFLCRWSFWALITGGGAGLGALLALPPWHWPGHFAALGISWVWKVEAVSMCMPALIGCLVGQDRKARPGEMGGAKG